MVIIAQWLEPRPVWDDLRKKIISNMIQVL